MFVLISTVMKPFLVIVRQVLY